MSNGKVVAIFIAPEAGAEMQSLQEVTAIENAGLEGDRYCNALGSYNRGRSGSRQVTLINGLFFERTGFRYGDARRNIVTLGVELMWLIGKEFDIGEARFYGVKYCDPCQRPSVLAGHDTSFQNAFFDRGGLIAKVVRGGLIRVDDAVVPPPKGY